MSFVVAGCALLLALLVGTVFDPATSLGSVISQVPIRRDATLPG